jgi:hypothetical protein
MFFCDLEDALNRSVKVMPELRPLASYGQENVGVSHLFVFFA